ncbi:MAG: UPF0175 family protein [Methanophagales archaeon]|nr:UPF0175 family protein [Methanophagales archaeon]
MSERCAAVIRWSALVSGSYINEERKKNRRNKMIEKTVSVRIPRELDEDIKWVMHAEGIDSSSVIRKIIDLGIKEWKRERALELLRRGNVTIMKAASLAGVSIYEMLKLVKERDIAWVAFDEDDIK